MEIKSLKPYRFQDNPKEKDFFDEFNRSHSDSMDFIVFGQKPTSGFVPADYLSDREKEIVLATIQWLGSPVGQGFLERIKR